MKNGKRRRGEERRLRERSKGKKGGEERILRMKEKEKTKIVDVKKGRKTKEIRPQVIILLCFFFFHSYILIAGIKKM